ncbi:MAG: trigger factor [Faecalibacterium sp.]|jgi:trigger factor|nr:trigger factor [Faecalibacterium sp.]
MAEKYAEKLPPMPKAKLGQYRGLCAECHVHPVTEGQIDLAIETLRMRAAVRAPISGQAARGDEVTLDFEGFTPEGQPIPDSRLDGVTVRLGKGQMLPGVEAAICGHCAGETFSLDFTYPQPFRVPELAGTKARFSITLHTVARQKKPALDDAFAVSQGCENLAALREKVRAEKQALHEHTAKQAVRTALLDQAGQNLTVDFPPALLDGLTERKMERLRQQVAANGSTLEQYFSLSHQTAEKVRAEMRAETEKGLRRRLAVEAIAEKEQITACDEEIEAEYARLAGLGHTPEAELRKTLTRQAVRGAVLSEKVCGLLAAHARLSLTENIKEE